MADAFVQNSKDIASMLPEELKQVFIELEEQPFRANQLFEAFHKRFDMDIQNISNFKQALKMQLKDNFSVPHLRIKNLLKSQDGTRKYQFETHDGHTIESVFIPNASKPGRNALCISSQVGCAMGCTFCATAALSLKRNLVPAEIVLQVYMVIKDVWSIEADGQSVAEEHVRPIHNIVFMGMGEPLHNFDNVLRAIELLTHPQGLGMSPRRITVSTSGLVKEMERLGMLTDVHLAVSLNATTDATRSQIMPVNRKWNIETLLLACQAFPLKVRERITFEYVLLKDVNDSDEDARRLVKLLGNLPCKINLIPFNEHPLSTFKRPDAKRVEAFQHILFNKHLSAFVRKTRGDDIDAACGMLGAQKLSDMRNQQIANG